MKECLVCVDSWTFVHAGMLQLELGLVCRFLGILSANRRDGTAVLYGFVGIRSSWYVAVGA